MKDLLDKWKKEILKEDGENNPCQNLAILYLSSHGCVKDSTYYFVTEDSFISGTEIIETICYLANAGVKVLVFIDTCHGAALFKKHFRKDMIIHKLGGVAFFASSSDINSSYRVSGESLFATSISYCLSGQYTASISDGSISVSSLEAFVKNNIETIAKKRKIENQDPETQLTDNIKNFIVLKKCKFPYHLQFAAFNPFAKVPDLSDYSRFAESNARAKTYSTILHGFEIASIIGAATSIGIIASQRSKIKDLDDRGLDSNKNRKTARMACYWLYGSTAVFALAYGLQVVNIHHQFKKKHIVDTFESIEKGYKDKYVSSVSFGPVVNNNYLGVGLTYEF